MTPTTHLIAFINAAHALCHYCLLILPTAVLAMVVEGGMFGREYGPVLALATGMFVLYGLLSLPQGWLADRFGRQRMIAVYFFGAGAALVACGLAPTAFAFEMALAVVGAFAAIYHPIGTAMLVELAGSRSGRTLGTNGVFGNTGVALAPVTTAALATQFGWQAAFVVPGLVFLGLGMAWVRLPMTPSLRRQSTNVFAPIPRALVRRAVIVLLLLAEGRPLVPWRVLGWTVIWCMVAGRRRVLVFEWGLRYLQMLAVFAVMVLFASLLLLPGLQPALCAPRGSLA